MNPGTFDRQINIQARTLGTDRIGGVSESWSNLYTVWARMVPAGGNDTRKADARAVNADFTLETRFLDGITAEGHRVTWRSETYDIIAAPIEIGRRHLMRLQLVKRRGPQ
jgi:SPP1 family predicted phage head-tail adaptor